MHGTALAPGLTPLAAVSDIDAPPCAEGETISKARPKIAALLLCAAAENAAAVPIREPRVALISGITPIIPGGQDG